MIGALWILLALCLIGVALYLDELRRRKSERTHPSENSENSEPSHPSENSEISEISEISEPSQPSEPSQCCGLHLVCEKDSLSPMSTDILYYDDEELDRFIGRDPASYTPEETEEFRDVLMTLRPEDVAGWARSVTQRRLPLPPDVRDELLLIINDQRRSSLS